MQIIIVTSYKHSDGKVQYIETNRKVGDLGFGPLSTEHKYNCVSMKTTPWHVI